MTGHPEVVSIDLADALELVELLDFVVEWCTVRAEELSGSLEGFVGIDGSTYGPGDLADEALRLGRHMAEAGR